MTNLLIFVTIWFIQYQLLLRILGEGPFFILFMLLIFPLFITFTSYKFIKLLNNKLKNSKRLFISQFSILILLLLFLYIILPSEVRGEITQIIF